MAAERSKWRNSSDETDRTTRDRDGERARTDGDRVLYDGETVVAVLEQVSADIERLDAFSTALAKSLEFMSSGPSREQRRANGHVHDLGMLVADEVAALVEAVRESIGARWESGRLASGGRGSRRAR